MARWLQEMGVKTVAMESTGVYWVPVYEILEDHGRQIAALRASLRLRECHLEYAASHIQPMQKALTFMNLQLHPVVSDMTGATGMRMIRAIVGRERNPQVLARMRDDRCKASEHTVQSA